MGRRWALTVCLALMLALPGCAPLVETPPKPLSVYASFYPIYTLADAVLRNIPDMALHCLAQPQDGCLRSYTLSDWDVRILASGADAVLLGGRGLESFEGALLNWGEGGPAVAAVLYNTELYNAGTTHARADSDSHLEGPNPHLYLSVDGALHIVEAISGAMMTLDPRYEVLYLENEASAEERLHALKARVDEITGALMGKKVALMNEALIYPALDYGLEVVEWIDRESGQSFYDRELEECLQRLDKSGARVVLIEAQAPISLIMALEAAGYRVAKLDVLSTHREGEGFETYLKIMEENAKAVQRAFEGVET